MTIGTDDWLENGMPNWRIVALLGLLGMSYAAGVRSETDGPFVVDRDQILERTHTIAVADMLVDPEIEHDDAAPRYTEIIAAELRQAGFVVIAPEAYTAILDGMIDQVGGIYDPITGKRDDEKHEAVTSLARREFRLQYDFDAILRPAIVQHTVRYSDGEAAWHGVTEAGSMDSEAGRFWFGPSEGNLDALSLVTRLEDAHGELWYADAGGIGLMQLYDGAKKVDVPAETLLRDTARGARAAKIALGALVRGKTGPDDELEPNAKNSAGQSEMSGNSAAAE